MGGWGVRIPSPTYLTDGAGPPTAARLPDSRTVSMVPLYMCSAGTVRKMGTWTAVAELPILLSVFSDTDVATVLRAER